MGDEEFFNELLRSSRGGVFGPVISPPPTHAELAGRVNSNRETVTRKLGAMDRTGLIERRRGAIVLLEADRLRQEVAEAVAGWQGLLGTVRSRRRGVTSETGPANIGP